MRSCIGGPRVERVTDRSGKRILVVDDAALVRRYHAQALARAGYAVDEAMNGLEALEKLLARPADLVILDVNMPRMDGFTFLANLRRQPGPIAGIPVIVITAETRPQDFSAAPAAGANFLLVKPVRQETLAQLACLFCGDAP
jgi:two-component system chemotaxis response regulator CheY